MPDTTWRTQYPPWTTPVFRLVQPRSCPGAIGRREMLGVDLEMKMSRIEAFCGVRCTATLHADCGFSTSKSAVSAVPF